MNKISIITAAAAAVIATASCSDFLDIRVEATMPSTGTDYTKVENLFQPVSAAYASMREDIYFPYICVTDVVSDDSDKGSDPNDNDYAKQLDQHVFNPATNYMFNALWSGYYNMISACNNALYQEGLYRQNMTIEENILNTHIYSCEAKVIRAYAYMELTRIFGSVPIVENNMTAEQLANNPQVPLEKLYDYMYKDLDNAIDSLPDSWGKNWGCRYNKYTALALKAKIAMYRKDWNTAAAAADAIISSGKFALQSDYRYLFSVDGEGCPESLMEIEGSDLGLTSGSAPILNYAYYQGPRNNKPAGMQGWGFNTPNENLLSFLKSRGDEKRIGITFLERGTTTPEGDYISETCPNKYYNGKVYTPLQYNTFSTNAYGFDHNIRLIRYAEILLIYAEALVNGAPAGSCGYSADDALHLVQDRAGIANTAATIDSILDERRAELALEGNRIFDLIRSGKANEVLGSTFAKNFHEHFPIPGEQIQLNSALVKSPGYNY